jgi:hypothetical protein
LVASRLHERSSSVTPLTLIFQVSYNGAERHDIPTWVISSIVRHVAKPSGNR